MKPLLLILLLMPGMAFGQSWQVDAAASHLGFAGDYEGMVFQGTFPQFQADIRYDPADLAHARFDVTVQLGSVNTQNGERDEVLVGDAFFDVARFPVAHYVTRSFSKDADGKVVAHGSLSMRGVTLPVDLEVNFQPNANGAILDVTTIVSRSSFHLGDNPDWAGISTQIKVNGHLLLRQASAKNASTASASNGQSSSRPESSSRSTGTRVP